MICNPFAILANLCAAHFLGAGLGESRLLTFGVAAALRCLCRARGKQFEDHLAAPTPYTQQAHRPLSIMLATHKTARLMLDIYRP